MPCSLTLLVNESLLISVTESSISIDSDSQFVPGLMTLLCNLSIHLKKKRQIWSEKKAEDHGEFVRNFFFFFFLQTVIILALLFGGTEMARFTFKNK